MCMRVTIFQREGVRKIHCCCIGGGIYNLKKVYSMHYFHLDSMLHETRKSNINGLIDVNLLTQMRVHRI
jgi:hypothetical protein